ncbi:MAG: hypothetical protein ABFC77_15640 [Thermoguttaceae bacterium]|jgi:hypothetical protein
MDPQQSPGFMQRVADALRRYTGMGGTTDLSAAAAAQTLQQQPGLREMQIRAAEAGMPVEEYVRLQQQGGMPR